MIRVETNDTLRTITIDRPEKANALSRAMLCEIRDAVLSVPDDLRALVLRGTGKVFSAGADLNEAGDGLARDGIWAEISGAIASLPCLTIAALNGTLAGGATGLALACDLRLAVPGARIFYPVMRLGYIPPAPDPGRLVALIGPARAKMILLGGQRISVEDAFVWGLIDRIVSPEAMDDEIEKITADARQASADHVHALKAIFANPQA